MPDAKNGWLSLSLTIVVMAILLLMTRAALKMDDESNVDCVNPLDSSLKKVLVFSTTRKSILYFLFYLFCSLNKARGVWYFLPWSNNTFRPKLQRNRSLHSWGIPLFPPGFLKLNIEVVAEREDLVSSSNWGIIYFSWPNFEINHDAEPKCRNLSRHEPKAAAMHRVRKKDKWKPAHWTRKSESESKKV